MVLPAWPYEAGLDFAACPQKITIGSVSGIFAISRPARLPQSQRTCQADAREGAQGPAGQGAGDQDAEEHRPLGAVLPG